MNYMDDNFFDKCVTPEYLLSHGFRIYKSIDDGELYDIPFVDNPDSICFREIEFHRQIFVVIFGAYNGDPKDGYHKSVYVQEDAGCGFVEIPFPWWDLPIEHFESVYYGIRGNKPNFNPKQYQDTEYEIVAPKQLTDKP